MSISMYIVVYYIYRIEVLAMVLGTITTCYVVTEAKRRLSDTTAWSSRIYVGNMLIAYI